AQLVKRTVRLKRIEATDMSHMDAARKPTLSIGAKKRVRSASQSTDDSTADSIAQSSFFKLNRDSVTSYLQCAIHRLALNVPVPALRSIFFGDMRETLWYSGRAYTS
ncbi:MAG: hypothetical protein J07HQX50_01211, partial [Haloquadratum sp. J07HQX50]